MNPILDRIKTNMPKTGNAKIFGEEVAVKLFSTKQIHAMGELFEQADENTLSEFVSDIFLDPATGEKVFTPEFIRDEMPQAAALELLTTFKKVNGVSGSAVEDAEKN